ncbi:MAG: molybdopterin-dependent oxidoreductase [Hyphomicrobiaceae bacterium]
MIKSAPASVRTTCPYCGVGCGVLATLQLDGTVDIKGDPAHPSNYGRLCSKGSALGETLSFDDRLLYPTVNGTRTSWDDALSLVARTFAQTVAAHGPDSVAIYGSGQLLTEDYYVANKLMKGFIGTANMDTNSRLCMASSVAGHVRAFGADTVPGTYEDLECADLVVLVGSNLAWCHPVLFQRLEAARQQRGTKIVVIDPRRTATCEIADTHLALAPGSDVALFNGLLAHLAQAGRFDHAYVEHHTTGLDAALESARAMPFSQIVELTGLIPAELHAFYDLFATTGRVVTVYSQGVNQSSAGTDKVNAIINCHLATGRIGREGMGPFSVTGQPNAMGGREVGGLANMLAAHMSLDDPNHRRIVADVWQSKSLASKPGLKATDMFAAVADGRIKAIWIISTNPADSLPQADTVVAALKACPFVVVSDAVAMTDTTALGHVLLPATAWGEKSGTVTNSERRISRQRPFMPPPGEAMPDWWIICEVAKRMGYVEAFAYDGPAAIFAEHARLSSAGNHGTRDFDIGAYSGLVASAYDGLEPFQWPQAKGQASRETRFFAHGNYYTRDGKARAVATPYRAPASATSPDYPLALNTGRIRDQWHTMTRSAKTARLMSHIYEPFAEIHPADARAASVSHGQLVTVASPHGSVVVRADITDRQRPGSVFVPMHWTGQFASSARIDAVMAAATDPISGQPELKHTPVAIIPFAASHYGLLITVQKPTPDAAYWAVTPIKGGWRTELAWTAEPADWATYAAHLLQPDANVPNLVAYRDTATGQRRFAAFDRDRLTGAVFIARNPITIGRAWAAQQISASFAATTQKQRLLAGRTAMATADNGPTVCACFDIGANQIAAAATHSGCTTVDAIGACLKAGTNCGSCRSEIKRILDANMAQKLALTA